jgi:hypothetical protein
MKSSTQQAAICGDLQAVLSSETSNAYEISKVWLSKQSEAFLLKEKRECEAYIARPAKTTDLGGNFCDRLASMREEFVQGCELRVRVITEVLKARA